MAFENMTWFLERVLEYILQPYESRDTFLHAISHGVRAFVEPHSKTGWLYLLSSMLIAGGIFVVNKKRFLIDPTMPFLKFLCPREVYLHPSALVDYQYVAVDSTIKMLVYTPLISGLSYVSYKGILYARTFLPLELLTVGSPTAPLLATLVAVLVMDFGFFYGHYLAHKIPLFWYFHQVHHSAEVLTPITVYRTHPVEECVATVASSIVAALGTIIFMTGSSSPVSLVTVFELNLFMFLFFFCAYQLRHSHIWLSYGPVLSRIFISPAQHQIHHSKDPNHHDKNYGFVFSIWDGLFGSLYIPRSQESLKFGLSGMDPHDFSSVSKLYFLPFAKAGRHFVEWICEHRRGTSSLSDRVPVETLPQVRTTQSSIALPQPQNHHSLLSNVSLVHKERRS